MKKELKSSIHVRLFQTSSISTSDAKDIPINKGNLDNTINGETNNLIRAAFESLKMDVVLPQPLTDEAGNVVMCDGHDEGDGDQNVEGVVEGNNEDPSRLVVEYTAPIVTPPRIIMQNKPPSYLLSQPAYLQLAVSNI